MNDEQCIATNSAGRLTRAMHKAAKALYAAGFEREREEPSEPERSESPKRIVSEVAQPEEGIPIASDEIVLDIPANNDDEGGGVEEASRVPVIEDQGIPDSSGEAQR